MRRALFASLVVFLAAGSAGCAALEGLRQFIQPPQFSEADGQPAEIRLLGPGQGAGPLGGAAIRLYTRVRNPNPFGLTLRTRREELYRALVDSLALAARDHLTRFEAVGLAPPVWRAAGGGTRDAAWPQATADALGAPLELCAWAGDAVGPALLALSAIGTDVQRPVERIVHPDPARGERYALLYEIYRTLHPSLAPAMHALGELDRSG